MIAQFDIVNMQEVSKGNLLATASIIINGIIINQLRIIQTTSGPKVAVPLVHWKDQDGHVFKEVVVFDSDQMDRIEKQMIKEFWIRYETQSFYMYE